MKKVMLALVLLAPGVVAFGEEPPRGADGARPRRSLRFFAGGGATRYLSVHDDFDDPWVPKATLGVQLDRGVQPRASLALEWTPARTFMRWPGGGETRVGTTSALAALEWSRRGRMSYAFTVGVSRQLAEEVSSGGGVDFRDPTLALTLGGDVKARLHRGVSAVPYILWDTDGARLAYTSQLRSGIGLRAMF